jgi:hypothetical protein
VEKTLVEMSASEFEELVERTIDRRINVWFTQLMDALTGSQEEEGAELQHEFAASLRRALEQARSECVLKVMLSTFTSRQRHSVQDVGA